MGGKPARRLNSTLEGIVVVVVVGSGSLRGGGAPSFSRALRNLSFALALPRWPGFRFGSAKRRECLGAGLLLLMKPPVLAASSTATETSRRSMVLRPPNKYLPRAATAKQMAALILALRQV